MHQSLAGEVNIVDYSLDTIKIRTSSGECKMEGARILITDRFLHVPG